MIPPRGTTDRRRGGKQRLIREGGSASRVSIHARPRDPGGGTVLTVPPRRTILDDVSLVAELSGGGGAGGGTVLTVLPRWTILDDVSLAAELSGGNLRWFLLLDIRQYRRKRLWLRTLLDGSVLMMLLDYTRIRALCGCQMMVCL